MLITQGDLRLYASAFGRASRAWKIPNNLETRFDTASITKLFTAVATLQLIDQKLLAFDTRIIDRLGLEGTAISNEVTVYHLLTHTSRIADDAEEENNVRPVQPSDAAEWLRMRVALWPDDPEKEAAEIAHFLSTMPRSKLPMLHEAFVCPRPDGKLCGLVEVSIRISAPGCQTDRIGYLEAWYVDPVWRNQGIGRALVEQAEAWARAEGCVEMASDTAPSYPLSPAAHAALGYQEVERYFRKELLTT